jgi:L-2-hydroxyglutarate oxidase LhgO
VTEVIKTNCIIIGGGVAGLSVARKFSLVMDDVFLVEQDKFIGNGVSSRNSEVIHAGIYYKPESLKHRLILNGKDKLYSYLRHRNIPCKKTGKYIVASTHSEVSKLVEIKENARRCGLDDLFYDSTRFKGRYPFIKAEEAIFSPSTGIFDSHSYMNSLALDFEKSGGFVLKNNVFRSADISKGRIRVVLDDLNSSQSFIVETKLVINCAGLDSVDIHNSLPGDGPLFKKRYVKGDYYSYSGKEKIDNLIYPVPEKDGLGVHVTMDLSGQIRFGPSAYKVETINYALDTSRKTSFLDSITRYWPSIDPDMVIPSYSGIRPKLVGEDDFVVAKKLVGDSIMISVLGYESPGLSASLGLAEHIESIFNEVN